MADFGLIDSSKSVLGSAFGSSEEIAIVSLAIDSPEFYSTVGKWLPPEVFSRAECKWVMAILHKYIVNDEIIPPRDILIDHALSQLTVDSPYEPIVELLKRKSDPREL